MRVIMNGVSFYTSKKAILELRAGDNTMQNQALLNALTLMGKDAGIATTIRGYALHSFEMQKFDIQLSV